MDLIYFILSAYGLTQILVYGTIFKPIRPSHHFFHCTMCIGFWVGIFLWAMNNYTELFSFDYSVFTALLMGCLSSGTSYILNMVFGDEGINVKGAKNV